MRMSYVFMCVVHFFRHVQCVCVFVYIVRLCCLVILGICNLHVRILCESSFRCVRQHETHETAAGQ